MSTSIVQLTVVALFALMCGALVLAWMRGKLGVAAVALLAVSVVTWIVAFAVIRADYAGASEFATCGGECDAIHYVSAVIFLTPPLFMALAALAMLVARSSRWRTRRPAGEDPA
jgi:hypothetical protein